MIVNKTSLEVISEQEFRNTYKHISFPSVFLPEFVEGTDYVYLEIPQKPAEQEGYSTTLSAPYKYSGKIKVKWEVTKLDVNIEVKLKDYETVIDNLLSEKAREYKYDNVYTMISYRGDINPKFDLEARSMFEWRSKVWTKANELLMQAIVESSSPTFTWPSTSQLLELLPTFTLLEE